MFNLVGKRYLFLLISLIVIVPGTISLLFFHLNVGIDFAGGANVELRPAHNIQPTDLRNMLKPFNLQDLQIVNGSSTKPSAGRIVWVRLNTQVDPNVLQAIKQAVQNKYTTQSQVTSDTVNLGGKNITLATITISENVPAPKLSDIQTLLNKLPPTTDPTRPPTAVTPTPTTQATATVTGTSTPSATGTPAATATATAKPTVTASAATKSTGTPTGTSTPVISVTQTPNLPNIPVNAIDVTQGQTTQTITILTRSPVDLGFLNKIRAGILNANGPYTASLEISTVEGSVAAETSRNAFYAVIAASVLILLYVWFSFRKVARPWRYGTCAIIALLHDVLVVLGVFSILGWLFNIQIDALFITAILTVVGFSVHDTIVVFDRIRENMQRRTTETFEQVVNASLIQTMARSLNTSLTVLFTLTALTLFTGNNLSVRNFTLALLIGIFSGTYSSIFNASMLLIIWDKGELGFSRFNRDRTPDGREVRELVKTR